MSRFLIACGGTGGHLAPGVALAQALGGRGHECTLLVSQKRVDARLLEKYPQLAVERVAGNAFGWSPPALGRFALGMGRGLGQSLAMLTARRPDAIVGFGGFTAAGILGAAMIRRVPMVLHEANRVPGRATRLFAPFARRVYVPVGVKVPRVLLSRIRQLGLPVRREFRRMARSAAVRSLGLDRAQKVLLVLGGSQGAGALNDWVKGRLDDLAGEGIQVVCVTGLGKGVEGRFELPARTGAAVRSLFLPFADHMSELLSAADLVVSRAGAGSIAEIIRCQAPALLMPYPHAADNHQVANAAFFERQGGGLVVPPAGLDRLHGEVTDVIFNEWLLGKFRQNLARMDRDDAAAVMVRDLEEIVLGPRPAAVRTLDEARAAAAAG